MIVDVTPPVGEGRLAQRCQGAEGLHHEGYEEQVDCKWTRIGSRMIVGRKRSGALCRVTPLDTISIGPPLDCLFPLRSWLPTVYLFCCSGIGQPIAVE